MSIIVLSRPGTDWYWLNDLLLDEFGEINYAYCTTLGHEFAGREVRAFVIVYTSAKDLVAFDAIHQALYRNINVVLVYFGHADGPTPATDLYPDALRVVVDSKGHTCNHLIALLKSLDASYY
jgi:hypothetical protein